MSFAGGQPLALHYRSVLLTRVVLSIPKQWLPARDGGLNHGHTPGLTGDLAD